MTWWRTAISHTPIPPPGSDLRRHWRSSTIDGRAGVENIGLGYDTPDSMLIGFLNSNSGHRESVMGQGSLPETFRELGVGHRAGTGVPGYDNVWTVILTRPQSTSAALTGVVYEDLNNNGRMDLGEGIPNVTVRAGTTAVQTNAGGGWSIPIGNGTWSVTASGGGLPSA